MSLFLLILCLFFSTPFISETEYEEQTQWSDFNLVIPLLFNFYHGIEVLLKGFQEARGLQGRPSHKLSHLLLEFKREYTSDDVGNELTALFEKYIIQDQLPPILFKFCQKSNIIIDKYYQALKYPESIQGKQYQHFF